MKRRKKLDLILSHADGYEEKIRVTTASAIRIIHGFLNDGSSIMVELNGWTISGKTDAWNRFAVYNGQDIIL